MVYVVDTHPSSLSRYFITIVVGICWHIYSNGENSRSITKNISENKEVINQTYWQKIVVFLKKNGNKSYVQQKFNTRNT